MSVIIATQVSNFLTSIGINDNLDLIDTITFEATGFKIKEELSETQLALLVSESLPKPKGDLRRYRSATLGCNLGLGVNDMDRLLTLAGFQTIHSTNGSLILTDAGTEYGVYDKHGKIMWLFCVTKLLRKFM